jgi:hypothetical protein
MGTGTVSLKIVAMSMCSGFFSDAADAILVVSGTDIVLSSSSLDGFRMIGIRTPHSQFRQLSFGALSLRS